MVHRLRKEKIQCNLSRIVKKSDSNKVIDINRKLDYELLELFPDIQGCVFFNTAHQDKYKEICTRLDSLGFTFSREHVKDKRYIQASAYKLVLSEDRNYLLFNSSKDIKSDIFHFVEEKDFNKRIEDMLSRLKELIDDKSITIPKNHDDVSKMKSIFSDYTNSFKRKIGDYNRSINDTKNSIDSYYEHYLTNYNLICDYKIKVDGFLKQYDKLNLSKKSLIAKIKSSLDKAKQFDFINDIYFTSDKCIVIELKDLWCYQHNFKFRYLIKGLCVKVNNSGYLSARSRFSYPIVYFNDDGTIIESNNQGLMYVHPHVQCNTHFTYASCCTGNIEGQFKDLLLAVDIEGLCLLVKSWAETFRDGSGYINAYQLLISALILNKVEVMKKESYTHVTDKDIDDFLIAKGYHEHLDKYKLKIENFRNYLIVKGMI
jgi:hypothetical protein